MAEPSHSELQHIPQVADGLRVHTLNPFAREDDSVRNLIDSLSATHYVQVPFDSDVEGIPARNATYYRLVVPSRVSPESSTVVELADGKPDRAAELKAAVGKRLGEMASRPVVRELEGIVGTQIVKRVHDQRWHHVIAGVAAGYAAGAGADSEPLISLVYSRKLLQTETLLQRHIETEREAGRKIPEWMMGIESEEAVLSTAEERTRRLAGMMAQSMLLHSWEQQASVK